MLKISPPPVFDPRTVQPVASRYTDWAIPAHLESLVNLIKTKLRHILERVQYVDCEVRTEFQCIIFKHLMFLKGKAMPL
jgi:hypothetical protein